MDEARLQLLDTVEQLALHLLWSLEDLTVEQRYFYHGTSNSIAYTAWHTIRSLDRTLNEILQQAPQTWDEKGYRERLSMRENQPTARLTHEQAEQIRVEPWSIFLEYCEEVLQEHVSYLKHSSDAELAVLVPDSRVDMAHPSGDFSRGRLLRGRLTHASMHSGEIFALRGVQGLQGSPV